MSSKAPDQTTSMTTKSSQPKVIRVGEMETSGTPAIVTTLEEQHVGWVEERNPAYYYRALPLSPYQAPNLYRLTQYLAINAGLDSIPTLFYLPDSNSMNAFATSTSKGAAIAISYSLIKNVNEREMLGVIAHELAHIANGDLKIMALAQSANRILLFLSNFFQLMVL